DDAGFLVFDEKPISQDEVLDIITRTGSFTFLFEGDFHGRTEMLPGIIARDAEGNLHASSRKCTHEGCLVSFKDDIVLNSHSYQKIWYCRCHDAVFDSAGRGEVLAGPPPTSLPQFDIELEDGGEKVRLVRR
ncbi:MAG: ubiquinol-cytochrome c reductase iron-sulfur subunit, partial [Thermoplasmata archaeon]